MALIKTIDELKAVIPRMGALSKTANLPNIDKAGRLHIMPIIGKALYNSLDTKYNAQTDETTDIEKKLIKQIQLPLAAFALLDDLAFVHTVITDNGIRTNQSPNMAAAHRWEYKELEHALQSYATDGIELLLDFLIENKDSFADWTSSAEYKEMNQLLIKSGREFSRHYTISQPLSTFWNLKPTIEMVQENYLASTLGRQVLAWVNTQDDILVNLTDGQVDVKALLKKALAYLTIQHAGETLSVQFGADGFTVLAFRGSLDSPTTDGKVAAGGNDLQLKLDAAGRDGSNYLAKAKIYLQGIGEGKYGETLKSSIAPAYTVSPMKKDPNAAPITNGNENRKIFVFR